MQIPVEDIINIVIAATLFVVILSGFIILLVKLFDKARKNFALEKENINKEFESQLLKTQLEIQEQTLQNISQEIHDNIGQSIIFAKLNISTIDLSQEESANKKLQESRELLARILQDLRNLSKTLNPGFINEIGLAAGIDYQLSFLRRTGLYDARLITSEGYFKIPPDQELVIFRIVQELLNNIVKHAEAKDIEVMLDYQSERLLISVKDSGKGFNTTDISNTNEKGLGLRNMKSRLAMIKGAMSIESGPGKGTIATIEVPK